MSKMTSRMTGAIVCVGIAPMQGCGAELTLAERRHHGDACEYCALDFEERIRAWRFGQEDAELDLHFAEPSREKPAHRPARKAAA